LEASFAQVVVEAIARRRKGVAAAVEDAAAATVGCIERLAASNGEEEAAYVNQLSRVHAFTPDQTTTRPQH
jgi:hypothetical protein